MNAAARERRYASRKFLLACAVMASGHIALALAKIDAATWFELMKWAFGTYCLGNVGAVCADALKARQS